LGKLFTRI